MTCPRKNNITTHYHHYPRCHIRIFTIFIALTIYTFSTHAATLTWDNDSADNDWYNPVNWSDDNYPNDTDTRIITFGSPTTTSHVYADDDAQILISNITTSVTTDRLYIAHTTTGSLSLSDSATLNNSTAYLAYDPNTQATATITGPNTTWTNSSDLEIGYKGNATLNITDNATITNTYGILGDYPEAQGYVTISNSTWTNSNYLVVGGEGAGTLTINNNSTVTNTLGYIAFFDNAQGAVNVDGSDTTWTNSQSLTIANNNSTAALNITNGAHVTNTNAELAISSLAIATVTIEGSNSIWTNNGNLTIASAGNATFSITDGAYVTNHNAVVTSAATATAAITVDGDQSTWFNTDDLSIARNGDTTLDITNGAAVTSLNIYISGNPNAASPTSTAAITAANSTLTATNNLYIAHSGNTIFNATANANINTHNTITAYNDTADATISLSGSTWITTNDLTIAHAGATTLDITDSATITNTNAYIASTDTAQATVTITGQNTTWTTTEKLVIAQNGSATVDITDSAIITSTNAYIAGCSESEAATAAATVTVDGTDSIWVTIDSLTIAEAGAATFDVKSGASVTVGQQLNLYTDSTINIDNESTFIVGATAPPTTPNNTLTIATDGCVTAQNTNINADLINHGSLIGNATISGQYTQHDSASLAINIAGTNEDDFDTMAITQSANLAGSLNVFVDSAYEPAFNDFFTIITAEQIIGDFDSVGSLHVKNEYFFELQYFDNSVELIVIKTISGDADLDWDVDADDLAICTDNFGIDDAVWEQGDFNNDNTVDSRDLMIWQRNFGSISPCAPMCDFRTVPEPTTFTLLAIFSACLLRKNH